MSEDLTSGLAATANEPTHDTQPSTPDAVLDAAFEGTAEGSESSDTSEQAEPANDANAGAIVQPQGKPEPKRAVEGAPPPDKWEHVLANARTKAREEALAEHREKLEIVERLRSDFPGTLAQLLEEGAGDPRFAEAITTKAAAILAARRQQAKADDEPQPDAVMRFEDGTTEPSFSPAQQRKWMEWRERQMKNGLLNEFKPLLELKQQVEQTRENHKLVQQAAQVAEERSALWKAMPHFEDHKDAILKRQQEVYAEMEAAKGPRFDPVNAPWVALQKAYAEVVSTQAIPKLQSQQTDTLVAQAARKRAGSSSDPAAAAPAQPRKPRTVDEALDQGFGVYAGA